MKTIKVRCTLLDEMLGTTSANPEIHREFIASKAPDAQSAEEEVAAIGVEAALEKSTTIFPKENGVPFMWGYQIKGFFKEAFNALREMPDTVASDAKSAVGKRLTKWSYKKTVDGLIMVNPRKIMIKMPEGRQIGTCSRPIRVEGMRGERVALVSSETVPEGSTFEFDIVLLDPRLEKAVIEALDYGQFKGFLQWRNAGKGTFSYEVLA